MDDERDQHHVILSNNKIGNHNAFVALVPIVTVWSGLATLLLLVGMIVFWATNPHGFAAFMPQVFIWTIYAIGAAITVTLTSLAIKYVLGGFITHVIGALMREVVEPLRKNRVHLANENFVAYTGDIKVSHHDDARYSYNIKQVEGPPVAGLLPAPTEKPVPTARQLIEDGTVEQIIKQGEIILGFLEDGTMKKLPYDLLYSTDLGGVGGSGKTTTAFWLCVQEIMAGTRLIVVDPHLHVRRRGMAQGLGQLLAPFKTSYLFAPCADDSEQIMKRAKWMRDENKRRQGPGVNLDREPQVMMVVDEFNSIIAIEEIKQELGDIIATVQREGRKLGLFFLLVGHRWSQQDIGNVKIRTNAATVMAHYYNDADQADKLLGGSGKLCQQLKAGSYWLRGLMTGDLCKVRTPKITEADTPIILDLLGQPTTYPTGTTVEAEQRGSHTTSHLVPESEPVTGEQSWFPRDGKCQELDFEKLALVREMVRKECSQNEIVAQIFAGMRNSDAIAEYRKYLACLMEEA